MSTASGRFVARLAVGGSALAFVPIVGAGYSTHAAAKALALGLAAAAAGWTAARLRDLTVSEFALCAFLACGGLSALGAHDGAAATLAMLPFAAWLLVARAVRRSYGSSAAGIDEVADLVVLVAGVLALSALVEALGTRWPWFSTARPAGTLFNRNYVAQYLAVALPLVVWRASKNPSIARLCGLATIAAVSILCRCRGAWLAAVAAMAVIVICSGHRWLHRRAVAALISGAIAGAVVPWPGLRFNDSVSATVTRVFEHETGSGQVRIAQHRVGLEILRSAPAWGVGPGGFEDAASEHAHAVGLHSNQTRGAPTPNSDWLRVAVEHGVLGLVALLGMFGLLAGAALRAARREHCPLGRAPALAASWVALLVCSSFDAALFRWEMIGLAGALAGITPSRTFELRATWRPVWVAMGVGTCTLTGCAAASQAMTLIGVHRATERIVWEERAAALFPRAQVLETLALLHARRGECDAARRHLTRANDRAPNHWGALVAVASCYRARSGRSELVVMLEERALAIEPHARELARRRLGDTNWHAQLPAARRESRNVHAGSVGTRGAL